VGLGALFYLVGGLGFVLWVVELGGLGGLLGPGLLALSMGGYRRLLLFVLHFGVPVVVPRGKRTRSVFMVI
jgi:hypothetical protein